MNTDQNAQIGAFVLRVSLGVMFLAHGLLLKVFVFTPAGTAGFFESLGLPGALAYLTIVAETVGGLLLIAGVGTRYVSAALIPVLLGALVLVHGDKGWVFSNAGGGWEYPAFLIAASVAQWFLGDGAYALKVPGLRPAVQH
jgi:putative oxidoreductase